MREQSPRFRMGSRRRDSRESVFCGCVDTEARDAHLEYRRRAGQVVGIFYGNQIKERELFPLIHVVSTGSQVHYNRPGAITAGAADAAVVAMD